MSELQEICREKPSRSCRDKGDRVGQKSVPDLRGLLAGSHLDASSSVKHPSNVIIHVLQMHLVLIWVDCCYCGILEAHSSSRSFLASASIRSSGTCSPIPEMPATVMTQGGCSYYSLQYSHVYTHIHSLNNVISLCPASVFLFFSSNFGTALTGWQGTAILSLHVD